MQKKIFLIPPIQADIYSRSLYGFQEFDIPLVQDMYVQRYLYHFRNLLFKEMQALVLSLLVMNVNFVRRYQLVIINSVIR